MRNGPADDTAPTPWQQAQRDLMERRHYDSNWFENPMETDGRWPDFLIIGAQKAGTTWLHQNLAYHPEVWMPLVKELHYFLDRFAPTRSGWERRFLEEQIVRARKTLDMLVRSPKALDRHRACLDHLATMGTDDLWYQRVFSFAGAGQMTGEASSFYCTLPRQVIAMIAQRIPCVRIILLLRDPIDRAWSHLRMQIEQGDERAAALATDYRGQPLEGYVIQSNYREMLNNWRCFVPGARLLIINFDDIADRPTQVLRQVCDFLHVTPDDRFFPESGTRVHARTWRPIPSALHEALKRGTERIYADLVAEIPEIASAWQAKHFG
jgi:hypothetical protein